MKKTTMFLCVLTTSTLLLTGCAKPQQPEETPSESEQMIDEFNQGTATSTGTQLFNIQVAKIADLDQNVAISKAGKLMGSSNITISAQANGRVQLINAKEGDVLGPGTPIIGLSDTMANYGIMRERAQVGLQRAELTYRQSELQLSKAVTDAQNALKKAQNDYVITQEKLSQSVRKAKIARENAQLSGLTTASLEVDKLQTELDNQLLSLKNSFQGQKVAINQLTNDILDQVDSILGITSLYKGTASRREDLISIRNSQAKAEAKQQFLVIKNNANIDELPNTPASDDELKASLDKVASIYDQLAEMLDMIVLAVDSSLEGPGLTTSQIAGFQTAIDTLRSTYQLRQTAFIGYQNSVNSIYSNKEDESIDTTIEQQLAIVKKNAEVSFENAELAYEQAVTSTKDGLFQADLNLTIAKENLDVVKKNKDLQLALLSNAIQDAQVALRDAQRQYNKLSIATPINAIVQEILVDNGQEVSIGTPVVKVVGTQNNEILVSLDATQIASVQVGQDVQVRYLNNNYTGTITAVGSVADATLSYPVTIKVDDTTIGQLGGSVSVSIPLDIKTTMMPLKAVEVVGNGKGRIYTIKDSIPQQTLVDIGQVRGSKIEIQSELPEDTSVILSDMSNFDPERNTIQIKSIQ